MLDTIVAVSTSMAGSAGINIIRISGEDSLSISRSIFYSSKINGEPTPNMMYLGTIDGNNFKEKAFCVFYKAPYSYTGEDVIEFHCHGGRAVTNAVVSLIREKGARPAAAGEFTKRAFLNGKMNLAEAESVRDMINASSESEINNAYRLMNGEISQTLIAEEKELNTCCAMLEAKLDYPEELEEETREPVKAKLKEIKAKIDKILDNSRYAKKVTDGVNIAIIGEPNAGKSSLLNALIKKDSAIVTDIAGTTRDVVNESVVVDGVKLNFLDTAGIRESDNEIEVLGIERSKMAVKSADLVLFVADASRASDAEEKAAKELTAGKNVIFIDNKSDIAAFDKGGIKISAKKGDGVEDLLKTIMVKAGRDEFIKESVMTNERQIFALQRAQKSVFSAINNYDALPSECVLVDLREALTNIGMITGSSVSDNIIEEVFRTFCVGK